MEDPYMLLFASVVLIIPATFLVVKMLNRDGKK
jgi:hypothetical protein